MFAGTTDRFQNFKGKVTQRNVTKQVDINNIEITEPEQKPSIKDFEAFKKQLLKKLDLINEIISF